MEEHCYKSLLKYEKTFHNDIWKFMVEIAPFPHGSDAKDWSEVGILDFSEDFGISTQLLAERFGAKKLMLAIRDDFIKIQLKPETETQKLSGFTAADLAPLGKFDVILLKEMLHEVPDMVHFFHALKGNLKCPKHSKIFIVNRPKYPPLPLPDDVLLQWRKIAKTKQEIIEAAAEAEFEIDMYSVSVPIHLSPTEWGLVVLSRVLPATRAVPVLSAHHVKEFINARCHGGHDIRFEEKMQLFRLRME